MEDDPTPAAAGSNPNDPDDALAERLADAFLERARRPGIFRLHAFQAAGLIGKRPSRGEIGKALGISAAKVGELERMALLRLRLRFPQLRLELREGGKRD
jgi:hypothetical protein